MHYSFLNGAIYFIVVFSDEWLEPAILHSTTLLPSQFEGSFKVGTSSAIATLGSSPSGIAPMLI